MGTSLEYTFFQRQEWPTGPRKGAQHDDSLGKWKSKPQ